MNAGGHFAPSYEAARASFLQAADAAGLAVETHPHPLRGRDGETLAVDVVRDGPPDAERLLLVSSGCHGVEGFCGSAVQHALLGDGAWRRAAHDAGVTLLHVHALNPHGFSWWRRVTEDNVDLNRNFRDFGRPLPENPAYDELADLLVPATWPPSEEVNATTMQLIRSRGLDALQAAVSRGQHRHPTGLFYGGTRPTWSHRTVRQILRDHAGRCRRLAWIDLHSGLGPAGQAERIFAGDNDPTAIARARAWWGEQLTSPHDGSASSALLGGEMYTAVRDDAPQAEYTGIALEFGTLPLLEVLNALRGDQWLENHPQAPEPLRRHIKRQIRDAFCIDTADWKLRVLAQAREAARDAVSGLAGG